jgi:hypothetical protein
MEISRGPKMNNMIQNSNCYEVTLCCIEAGSQMLVFISGGLEWAPRTGMRLFNTEGLRLLHKALVPAVTPVKEIASNKT